MAMNKKERAEFEEMRQEVRISRAFRFTDPVKPDVPPPDKWGALSTGYLCGGSRVDVACSGTMSHAFGQTDKTTSQNARTLFSTKKLALKALRHVMERRFAKELAEIDRQIEVEDAGQQEAS